MEYLLTYCVLSHSVMSDSLRPYGLQPAGYSVHGNSPAKNTGVGCLAFIQGSSQVQFSSVQFSRSVVSDSLQPHELQHARLPCPSPTPGVHSNSCPSSR